MIKAFHAQYYTYPLSIIDIPLPPPPSPVLHMPGSHALGASEQRISSQYGCVLDDGKFVSQSVDSNRFYKASKGHYWYPR